MSPEVHTLAGAYALDAVNDIERAEFARHMAQCPACAQEVAELQATAARLADMVAVAPPAWMRGAVLGQIGQTRQVGPWRRDAGAPAGQARWRRVAVAVAAAVVVAAGAGTFAVQEEHRVRDARAAAAEASTIAAVLGARDARVRSEPVTGGGQVKVVVSDALREGVAVLSDLPTLAAGHSYQLWLLPPGQTVNVGVLRSGTGRQLFTDRHGAPTFAVSEEQVTTPVTTPGTVVQKVPLL
ncbi:MAG: hypothetical protein V7603_2480 [Micromonosporaceae bacterium]